MQNLSKHQKFEAKNIHRSEIKNAPYNPRIIDEAKLNRLKQNIKRIGLIETLVWNKRTGNLVSGHQRLKILDQLEKSPDYHLTVSVVDFDDKTEKEQNIFMNNQNAQGEFDFDLIKELLPDIDFKNAGITENDLNIIGIELDLEKHSDSSVIDEQILFFEKAKQDKKEQIKEQGIQYPDYRDYKKVKGQIDNKNVNELGGKLDDEHEDYFVVTFSNWHTKETFLRRFEFEERDRYVKGEIFQQRINKAITGE